MEMEHWGGEEKAENHDQAFVNHCSTRKITKWITYQCFVTSDETSIKSELCSKDTTLFLKNACAFSSPTSRFLLMLFPMCATNQRGIHRERACYTDRLSQSLVIFCTE